MEDADARVCSFCGKTQEQVRKLIAGPGVHMCDECIAFGTEVPRRGGGGAQQRAGRARGVLLLRDRNARRGGGCEPRWLAQLQAVRRLRPEDHRRGVRRATKRTVGGGRGGRDGETRLAYRGTACGGQSIRLVAGEG